MWRILFLTFFLFNSVAFAQSQEKTQAIKFDEFGKLKDNQWKARLEKYQQQITCSAEPTFYIIHYSKLKFEIDPAPRKYLDYLVRVRCYDPPKVQIVWGGLRKKQWTEFWFVPSGAEFPSIK